MANARQAGPQSLSPNLVCPGPLAAFVGGGKKVRRVLAKGVNLQTKRKLYVSAVLFTLMSSAMQFNCLSQPQSVTLALPSGPARVLMEVGREIEATTKFARGKVKINKRKTICW